MACTCPRAGHLSSANQGLQLLCCLWNLLLVGDSLTAITKVACRSSQLTSMWAAASANFLRSLDEKPFGQLAAPVSGAKPCAGSVPCSMTVEWQVTGEVRPYCLLLIRDCSHRVCAARPPDLLAPMGVGMSSALHSLPNCEIQRCTGLSGCEDQQQRTRARSRVMARCATLATAGCWRLLTRKTAYSHVLHRFSSAACEHTGCPLSSTCAGSSTLHDTDTIIRMGHAAAYTCGEQRHVAVSLQDQHQLWYCTWSQYVMNRMAPTCW